MLQKIVNLLSRHKSAATAADAATAKPAAVEPVSRVDALRAEGNALLDRGDMSGAAARYRDALAADPDDAACLVNLGFIASEQRQYAEAQEFLERALASEAAGRYAHDAHFILGTIARSQGDAQRAKNAFHAALAAKPAFDTCRIALAECLAAEPEGSEAAKKVIDEGLALDAQTAGLLYAKGNLCCAREEYDAAAESFRRVIAIEPKHAEAHFNLGNVYRRQGRNQLAVSSFRNALIFRPSHVEALDNLGIALQELGDLDGSIESHRKALMHRPEDAQILANLAGAYVAQGRIDRAVETYDRAIALAPDFRPAYCNRLFCLNYHPDKSAEDIFAAYQDYDRHFGLPWRGSWKPHANDRRIERRLRVGYVSPDFRRHSATHFWEPLLAHHDKAVVEIYAYAELTAEDNVTARCRGYADHWRPTFGLSDAAVAEMVRRDEIDVLVDLAGHTGNNRLGVFALKPAPVSVSWMGFNYTTGLSAIDYFLTDDSSVPQGSEPLFSEQPWRLTTAFPYRPRDGMGDVGELPCLKRGHITFGTLTRAIRINHRSIRAWSQILKQVAGSRLVVDSVNFQQSAMQTMLADLFGKEGIQRDRLSIGFTTPPWDVFRTMDIGLDCFPHNSGTTLFESLYMAVPFVSLAGRPSVGRLGSSILNAVGHSELIAYDEDDYIDKAVKLAEDLERLKALKQSLRSEMAASPLMDEAGMARKIESAYRAMFTRWAATPAGDAESAASTVH